MRSPGTFEALRALRLPKALGIVKALRDIKFSGNQALTFAPKDDTHLNGLLNDRICSQGFLICNDVILLKVVSLV